MEKLPWTWGRSQKQHQTYRKYSGYFQMEVKKLCYIRKHRITELMENFSVLFTNYIYVVSIITISISFTLETSSKF